MGSQTHFRVSWRWHQWAHGGDEPRYVGSGAIRLVNGLYDAKMDHQPVVSEMRYVDGMKIKDPNKLGQTVALVAGIGIAEFLFSACRNKSK